MEICNQCDGTGKIDSCPDCDGNGWKDAGRKEQCECGGEKMLCVPCGGTGVMGS